MKYLALFFLIPSLFTLGQDDNVHPGKTPFKNFQRWKATQPGDVTLKNFMPFRAVYQRTYRQGSGSKKGEERIDRVIMNSERVAWDGRDTILFNMTDSGETHYNDTNSRTFNLYFDAKSLAVIMELGPVPGTAKDYYTMRLTDDKLVGVMVQTEQGEAKQQIAPIPGPGFGAPAPWVLGSMNLDEHKRIRFEPSYSMGLGVLNAKAPFRVIGTDTIADPNGETIKTWTVESVSNLTSPWVQHTVVTDRPPYLIRRESINKESREKRVYMDLLTYQVFPH